MKLTKRASVLLAMPLLVMGMFFTVVTPKAHASRPTYCSGSKHVNRSQCTGYFTGADAYSGALKVDSIIANGGALLMNVNSADTFTGLIGKLLNGGGTDETGAAFVVNGMLNRFGTDYTSVNSGVAYAKAHFDVWTGLVSDYNQSTSGSVNWNAGNVPTSFIAPFQDSGRSLLGAKNDTVFYMKQHNESHPVITFFNPDGTTFKINKESGSLIGSLSPLMQKPVIYIPPVTSQQLQEAQDNTAAQGVVQSFNGTTLVLAIDYPKQTVSLTVTASTTYTTGLMYDTAAATGLKAGSHAIVSYNIKTGNVTRVAYGL